MTRLINKSTQEWEDKIERKNEEMMQAAEKNRFDNKFRTICDEFDRLTENLDMFQEVRGKVVDVIRQK